MATITSITKQQEGSVSDLVDARYRLIEPLADSANTRSGYPTTWTAYDERLNRHVVLELVSIGHERSGARPTGLQDLLARRQATSPAVLDAGTHSRPDGPYFYMVFARVERAQAPSPNNLVWGPARYQPLSVGVWEAADATAKPAGHRVPGSHTKRIAKARRTRQAYGAGAPDAGAAALVSDIA
ncbi:MAG: hypothetical protein ABI232_09100 [Jatrophihabitantaceae bacterium]